MLTHDPGNRMLYLRRRRSRLPWIYLVYQEGVRGKGRGASATLNARSFTPCRLPLVPCASGLIPRDGEMPARRTPTVPPDRYRPHPAQRIAPPPSSPPVQLPL